ncbi:MAG TPA: hypothetical protein VES97_11170 [Solirubrobacteraceae bacterium]|nr:hypothetical protein [Solirubrobacteraceae bacterium]
MTDHVLLRPFPLAVMTLATFLVVFTLMMARLTAGSDPALRASAGSAAALVEGSGGSVVRTRASGSGAAGAATSQVAAAEGSSVATPAIVTRSSGATGVGDD